MNEREFIRLQRQLEDATSGEELDPRWADKDTTSLREGWQALDQVLAPLDDECPPLDRLMPPELRHANPGSTRRDWRRWTAAATAVAASMLVGIVATWLIVRGLGTNDTPGPNNIVHTDDNSDQSQEKDNNIVPDESVPELKEEKPQLVQDKPSIPDTNVPENSNQDIQLVEDLPDWDDPLDDEIASTQTSIQMLDQRINSSVASHESVWYKIDSLQEELDDESL